MKLDYGSGTTSDGMGNSESSALHGVFICIDGIGILIIGDSGLGKSECALELVSRGHVLVADDVVDIQRIDGSLFGEAPPLLFGLLEVRGLGPVSISEMFGATSVSRRSAIELCVEFKNYDPATDGDRIGAEVDQFELHGIRVPKYRLPVRAGTRLAILIETAAKLFALRRAGSDAESKLIAAHDRALATMK